MTCLPLVGGVLAVSADDDATILLFLPVVVPATNGAFLC
jgi:hypothetical protein